MQVTYSNDNYKANFEVWIKYFYIDKDEESDLVLRDRKPISSFDAFEEVDNIKSCPSDFLVYEDNKTPIDNKVFKIQQKEVVKSQEDFYVYTDDNVQGKVFKEPTVFVDYNDENQVYIDKNDENNGKGFKIPDVYVDNDENVFSKKSSKVNQFMGQKGSSIIKNGSKLELKYDKNSKQPIKIPKYQVYEDESYETNNTEKQVDKTKENSINPSNEGKSPIKKIPNVSLLYVYFVV